MLSALSIRDIVLIDKLDLEFGPGLCVLTGETGAGKSILLDAFTLAIGGRGDASLVRRGASQGQVTASFELASRSSRIAPPRRQRLGGRRAVDPAASPVRRRPHARLHQRRRRRRAALARGGPGVWSRSTASTTIARSSIRAAIAIWSMPLAALPPRQSRSRQPGRLGGPPRRRGRGTQARSRPSAPMPTTSIMPSTSFSASIRKPARRRLSPPAGN